MQKSPVLKGTRASMEELRSRLLDLEMKHAIYVQCFPGPGCMTFTARMSNSVSDWTGWHTEALNYAK